MPSINNLTNEENPTFHTVFVFTDEGIKELKSKVNHILFLEGSCAVWTGLKGDEKDEYYMHVHDVNMSWLNDVMINKNGDLFSEMRLPGTERK